VPGKYHGNNCSPNEGAPSVFPGGDDSKLGQLLTLALGNNWGVIGVSETWLSPSIHNHLIGLDGFSPPERNDRVNKRGGGVMIYCFTSIPYRRRSACRISLGRN
jgi:hypothetical protein